MPISGDYPCCNGSLWLTFDEENLVTPAFQKENCPHCNAVVWHVLSHWEPCSYTEENFLEKYDVDEEKKQVTKKVTDAEKSFNELPEELKDLFRRKRQEAIEIAAKEMEDFIFSGRSEYKVDKNSV
jgi:hypothetical protein